MTRYVDGLVGIDVQHLVEWYGVLYGREFTGGKIKVYCEVRFEQHVPSGLLKYLQFIYADLQTLFLLPKGELLDQF